MPKGERKKTQRVRKEAVFQAAVDAFSHGSIIVTPDARTGEEKIVLATRRLAELSSIPPQELRGKGVWAFWDDLLARVEHPTAVREDLERIGRNRFEERTDVLRIVRPQFLPLERFTVPLYAGGKYLGRLWAFRNANREFGLKEELHKERRLELFMRNLAQCIQADAVSPESMRAVCRAFCLGLDVASVCFFPRPGRWLREPVQFSVSRKHEMTSASRDVLAAYADIEIGRSEETGVLDAPLSTLPERVVQALAERQIVRLMLVPLIGADVRFGMLVVEENNPEREWTRDDAKAAFSGGQLASFWLAREETERNLLEARGAAEAAGRARSDFIALLSHELRTPLNPLVGFTQLMQESRHELTPEFQDMVSRIAAGARRLRDLVEDLLTLTRLDARLDGWRRYHCDPRGIVEDCAGWVKEAAAEKQVTLKVSIQPELGVVEADGAALRRAINAMLSNAVRYTPEGSEVRIEATGTPDSFVVRIADQGPGVAEDLKRKIFEPFVQGEPVLTRRFGGAGIGLTLVQLVADSHSGEAWVEDAPGGGSTFCLRIPRGFAPND